MAASRHLLAAVLLLAAAPATALGAGWSAYGGGPSHASHDALDPGAGTPLSASWEQLGSSDQNVRTGPIVTAGALISRRVVYGTDSGHLHVQELGDGSAVGSESGIMLDDSVVDDTDTFGSGDGVIAPVENSTALLAGQIYAVHNDEDQDGLNDIALAQVDAALRRRRPARALGEALCGAMAGRARA